MTLWLVPLLPAVAGPLVWAAGRGRSRVWLGATAGLALAATGALAVGGAVAGADASYRWGAGLELTLAVDDPASVAMVLVPTVALVVAVYAAGHEARRGLARLVGTLVAFVGAMELLVLAGDLLTLLVAWELVGACSWALIAHEWWHADRPQAAAQAFVATRAGDLGLFAAAGAALAGVGSLRYDALTGLSGGWLHLFAAGVVVAAVAKSAQVPFSPWLFSAMAGPTSVSALLHAATMVAAGAFVLVRLHPVLEPAGWFAPVVIGVGLVTALAGGLVAAVQGHAKRLLAASTSAHYGLMFVAVGAGVPAAALAHLVAHAAFKAPLFLAAGVAMEAVGTAELGRMRLGRRPPRLAAWTGVCALALAAVPPLGGAWTKEAIVTAGGHWAAWLAVAVALAGGLSAFYAVRLQLLAFGLPGRTGGAVTAGDPATGGTGGAVTAGDGGGPPGAGAGGLRWRGRVEEGAVAVGALASLALGALWWPGADRLVERLAGGDLPTGSPWELVLSLALVATGLVAGAGLVARAEARAYARTAPAAEPTPGTPGSPGEPVAGQSDRVGEPAAGSPGSVGEPVLGPFGRLGGPAAGSPGSPGEPVAGWLGLPRAAQVGVVDPVVRAAAALGRFDVAVLDAPPRAAAGLGRGLSSSLARADARVVDAGVRGVVAVARWGARVGTTVTEVRVDAGLRDLARAVGGAGRALRGLHTGLAHHYYVAVAAGAAVVAVAAIAWR